MDPELQKALDEMGLALKTVQDTADAAKKGLDALDTEKAQKAADAAAEANDLVNKLNATFQKKEEETKKFIERIDGLEKALAHSGKGDPAKKAFIGEYNKSLDSALRREHGAQVTKDQARENVEEVVKAYLPHLSDTKADKVVKTLLTGSNPDGGYWVPVDRLDAMITQIFETSPMRQLASTITTASNQVSLLIDDGEFSATWGNELSVPVNNDTPQVGELTIAVHNLFARATITENMLEDASIDIVGWLGNKATDKFARTENTGFVLGDGTNKPRGILTYPEAADPDSYERGAVGIVDAVGESGSLISADDFFNVQNHVKEPYQAGSGWMMKRRSFFDVATLKDTQGQYLLRMTSQVVTEAPMTLLGRPIVFADDVPGVATDALAFVYGNMRAGYTIVDRVGMTLLIDPYSEDPKVRYRYRKRLGGAVTNYEAFKILRLPGSVPA